jgi:hypothetical protein
MLDFSDPETRLWVDGLAVLGPAIAICLAGMVSLFHKIDQRW